MDANTTKPNRLLREQSELGPQCLQYRPPKVHMQMKEQTTIVVNSGKSVKFNKLYSVTKNESFEFVLKVYLFKFLQFK